MIKRKTYTSNEVKDRWNRNHYDRVGIYIPIGARAEIQQAAKMHGMSVSAYVRHLIIKDNPPTENGDILPILGGGEGKDPPNVN